jgi:ribosomal protein S18 acetylase RimI-like enzyme
MEPDREQAMTVFRRRIEECRTQGVRLIETRVITEQSDLEPALVAFRAVWHEAILAELGFERGIGRVEYRLPLDEAIARLEAKVSLSTLTWLKVENKPGSELERAARVLRAVSAGAPDSAAYDDALGHLLARREDHELTLPPESLQIGLLDRDEAAIIAPSVVPQTGWCSLYHIGVIPAYRGRRLGTEAMLHAFRAMREMGGQTYHDGMDAGNEAMLVLFRRLDAPLYRVMEQWKLFL